MRLLATLTLTLAALLVPAACASAQPPRPLSEAVAPAGMDRVEVRVPDDPRIPVRLLYAPRGQTRAQVWVDVLVADSADDAAARAEWLARTSSSAGLAPVADVGDRAWGDGGMVVFVRGETVAAVRVLSDAHDALAIARRVDGALTAARGAAAPAPRARLEGNPGADTPARVLFEGDVVGAHVVASGDAYARRSHDGWVVVRTGEGAFEVQAFVAGPDLRVHRIAVTD